MSTLELAITMAFVAAGAGAIVWWQVAAFDRKYGRSYGPQAKKADPTS